MNKTIREWFNFLRNTPNMKFSIQMHDGISSSIYQYFPASEFEKENDGWLDEICSYIYPNNFIKDGITYCLFEYDI